MTALTLASALALPQGHYINRQDANIRDDDAVSVGSDAVAITSKTSRSPILHTESISCCMCIAIENTNTGTLVMGHIPYFYPEALYHMLATARRNKSDQLQVHMIGACYDLDEDGHFAPYQARWQDSMEKVVQVLNRSPNTELRTFDVGQKPHPDTVAFFWNSNGMLSLVRGSQNFSSCQEIATTRTRERVFDTHEMQCASCSHDFIASRAHPFMLAYDGRLPEHQDAAKQREALNQRPTSGRSRDAG